MLLLSAKLLYIYSFMAGRLETFPCFAGGVYRYAKNEWGRQAVICRADEQILAIVYAPQRPGAPRCRAACNANALNSVYRQIVYNVWTL